MPRRSARLLATTWTLAALVGCGLQPAPGASGPAMRAAAGGTRAAARPAASPLPGFDRDALGWYAGLDADRDGTLRFEEYRALGVLALDPLPEAKDLDPDQSREALQRGAFAALDRDRDDRVSFREFEVGGVAQVVGRNAWETLSLPVGMLNVLDRNLDGHLTPDEWKWLGVYGVWNLPWSPKPGTLPLGQSQDDTFHRLNAHPGDGLDVSELMAFTVRAHEVAGFKPAGRRDTSAKHRNGIDLNIP